MEPEKQKEKGIRVVVADDIEDSLDLVCSLIKEVCPQAKIIGKHTTLSQTQKTIDSLHPDVVLLDIQFVSEGKTAFDLLELYRKNNQFAFKPIIFSGHCEREYYDMAFQYGAVHFLPKPVDKERLKNAIERVKPENRNETILSANILKNTLVINTATRSHFISPKDIVYFQSKDSYTYIVLANEQVIKSSRNLGFYEKQIKSFSDFFRVHNNTILNLNFIQGFSNKTERDIILKPPFGEIKSSREKFKELLEIIKRKT